jgi:putative transcriptional regulator
MGVPMAWLSRFVLPAVALLLAALGSAAVPLHDPSDGASLKGQLLIASPAMGDPRFYRTLVLIVGHDERGALGIVTNRPREERSLASLLEAMGEPDPSAAGAVRIFAGGPVEPGAGFVVHSADYHRPETIEIDGQVAVTSSREIIRDIAHHSGPKKALIAFGYAGWGAGQLENELKRGDWYTSPEEPKLIFEENPEKAWQDAVARRPREL